MAPRILTAWSAAFMPADEDSSTLIQSSPAGRSSDDQSSVDTSDDQSSLETSDRDDPIVLFFNNTIYTNRKFPKPNAPYSSVIFAFRDDGSQGTRLFQTVSQYGPMAVYDTYDEPIRGVNANTEHTLWVASIQPAIVTGHSTQDGSIKQAIDVGR